MTKKEAADRKRDLAEMAEHTPDQKARKYNIRGDADGSGEVE